MKGTEDATSFLSVAADVKTAARSLNCREFFVIEQAGEKGERLIPRVGRDDEGPVARPIEPRL